MKRQIQRIYEIIQDLENIKDLRPDFYEKNNLEYLYQEFIKIRDQYLWVMV